MVTQKTGAKRSEAYSPATVPSQTIPRWPLNPASHNQQTLRGVNTLEIRSTNTTTKTWVYVPCMELIRWKYVAQVQQQRPEFTYLVFTRMPGENYRRRLRSLLLYFCYVFPALINSSVCWFCTSALGFVLFQIPASHSYGDTCFPSDYRVDCCVDWGNAPWRLMSVFKCIHLLAAVVSDLSTCAIASRIVHVFFGIHQSFALSLSRDGHCLGSSCKRNIWI